MHPSGDPNQPDRPVDVAEAALPMLGLDELLDELTARASDIRAIQYRFRGLLDANRSIVGDLDLPVVLKRIVKVSCELVRARYGALGVIGVDGRLQQFVHHGMDPETVATIGHLPEGKGLLGAVIDDGRPIRLRQLSADDRSSGFPTNHPPMTSFLGVPIRIRGTVFGNLYLCDSQSGEFTEADEELVVSLAGTAAIAIENARLFDDARRRQDWLQASAEVTQQLLSTEGDSALRLIAEHVQRIAGADTVTVVLRASDEDMIVEVASGEGSDQLEKLRYPAEGTVARLAIETSRPVLLGDVSAQNRYSVHLTRFLAIGAVMAIPLGGAGHTRGALVVGRLHGRTPFTELDLEMATTFANYAAVALEIRDNRADQQRMVVLEDRDRIARDLHDHVIQRLFAAGLTLQSIEARITDPGDCDRVARVVDVLDDTIRQIRTSIFQLRGAVAGAAGSTARRTLLDLVDELASSLRIEPQVRFDGPIDAMVPAELIGDLTAVLREALTNIARHAQAHSVDVELAVAGGWLTLTVTDDGIGVGDTRRRSGLDNLARRAEQRNGSLVLSPGDSKGTSLTWTIPLT